MLASENEQLTYERNVPHVDITAELVAGWFDDSYHPDDPHFQSCFSPVELLALAEFNAVFDANVPHLPKSGGTVRSWLASSVWREVMHAASKTRSRIAP